MHGPHVYGSSMPTLRSHGPPPSRPQPARPSRGFEICLPCAFDSCAWRLPRSPPGGGLCLTRAVLWFGLVRAGAAAGVAVIPCGGRFSIPKHDSGKRVSHTDHYTLQRYALTDTTVLLSVSPGFVCELCGSNDVSFPFEDTIAMTCPDCQGCFHRKCWSHRKAGCLKCER